MMRPSLALCLGLSACAGLTDREHLGPVSGMAVAADRTVYSCSQAGVLTQADGREFRLAAAVPFRPFALAWIEPHGALLVAGGTPGQSGHLALVRPGGAFLHSRRLADDVLYAAAVDRSGQFAAAGGADGTVYLCRLGENLAMTVAARPGHAGPCRAVAFAPDRAVLASAGRDGSVKLWRPENEAVVPLLGHTAGVECLAFSEDGATLASGALDQRVRLHDLDGRLVRSWHRLGSPVQALAPGARGFYAGLGDGRVLFLDPGREAAEEVARFQDPVHALARRGEDLLVGLHGRVDRLTLPRDAR